VNSGKVDGCRCEISVLAEEDDGDDPAAVAAAAVAGLEEDDADAPFVGETLRAAALEVEKLATACRNGALRRNATDISRAGQGQKTLTISVQRMMANA
jgi:hypothetical protein